MNKIFGTKIQTSSQNQIKSLLFFLILEILNIFGPESANISIIKTDS